jgi:diguanylate cyclase (GGDEF)-like protein
VRAIDNWIRVPGDDNPPGRLPASFRPLARTCVFTRGERRAAAIAPDAERLIFQSIGAGIVAFDSDGRVSTANPAACEMLGSPLAALRGSTATRLLFAMVDIDGKPIVADALELGRSGAPRSLTLGCGLVAHERRWLSLEITTVAPAQAARADCSMVWALTDVTRLKRAQQQLAVLATTDDLTGLPNRTALAAASRQMLSDAAATGSGLAMLVLDLDGFKRVNDTLGHTAGDLLLRDVAARLAGIVRRPDLLGRRSGDEFVLLLPGGGENEAARMAEQVLDALTAPFGHGQRNVRIGASIGAALFPCHGETEAQLFRSADAALYEAKRAGRQRFRMCRPL